MQLSSNLCYQEEEPSILDSIFSLPATNFHVIIDTLGEEHIDQRHHAREFVHTTYHYIGLDSDLAENVKKLDQHGGLGEQGES